MPSRCFDSAVGSVSAGGRVLHRRWLLDEVYVTISGETRYFWRAVGHEGEALESFVTKTRDKQAALTFMKKTLKRHGSPKVITIDVLRSDKARSSVAFTEWQNLMA